MGKRCQRGRERYPYVHIIKKVCTMDRHELLTVTLCCPTWALWNTKISSKLWRHRKYAQLVGLAEEFFKANFLVRDDFSWQIFRGSTDARNPIRVLGFWKSSNLVGFQFLEPVTYLQSARNSLPDELFLLLDELVQTKTAPTNRNIGYSAVSIFLSSLQSDF